MGGDFPRSLLRPGERVVWHGAPAGGVPLRTRDLFLIPFSLLWCGFAIFWEASAVRDGAGWFFALWGVPFVLTGLFAVAGRFLAEMWLRARTRYAVTDRRVLIERDGPWGMLQTIDLADVGGLTLTMGRAGTGTVLLGHEAGFWERGRGQGIDLWVPALSRTPKVLAIVDARRVFDLIQREQERVREAATGRG